MIPVVPDRIDVVTFRHPGGPAIVADADCAECQGSGKVYPFRWNPNTYAPCDCVYTTYEETR